MWLNAANGLKPWVELVQAIDGLDRQTVRRVTRLTRRGEVTSNAQEARLSVALAHQTRQREPATSGYATIAVMTAIFLGIFIVQTLRGEIDSFGILMGTVGLLILDDHGRANRVKHARERGSPVPLRQDIPCGWLAAGG